MEALADDIGGSRGVSLNESQRFNFRLQDPFYLGAVALDSVDGRSKAGKGNRDVLRRIGQQGVTIPFREDRIGWSDDDAIDATDLESIVHQFFVTNGQKLYVLSGSSPKWRKVIRLLTWLVPPIEVIPITAPFRSFMLLNLFCATKLKKGALMPVEMARTGRPLAAERIIEPISSA